MKEDRRIRKTKEAIKNSFLTLLSEKPMSQITVREIVDQADINRTTFYHYYLDVADLQTRLEEDIYQQIVCLIDENIKKKRHSSEEYLKKMSVGFIADICTIAKENTAFCRCIFSSHGDIAYLHRLSDLIELKTRTLFEELYHQNYKSGYYLYSFIKGGVIGILQHWMDLDFTQTPQEISQLTYDLIRSLIISSMTKDPVDPSLLSWERQQEILAERNNT
jgi:AcrR family transcriptional regulator